ncbi:hypothetical protein AGMMS49975_00300 [Clostridia bacterium]|nr:hypothetical protein AGMMS49975_00300 [Clostridia bacterium]
MIDMVYDSKLTLVSRESLFATLTACKHAAQANIEGDFVECGVWRGGNAILAALTFQLQKCDKKVYCFDTFQGFRGLEAGDKDGFAQQTETDKELYASYWSELDETAFNPETAGVSLEDVRESFALCGVNPEKVVFVKGNVMKTLDGSDVPRHISVLRLDTDWYESTRKELEVLYPRVSVGGVLIVDDYGAHQGSRTATDEYFNKVARPMLQYTDWHARLGVKTKED